ncbi:hypothetical protein A3K93_00955 [Acinetobacter sp. NCu2D-2]|uniref:hypothetical protein n=1 Tax=Acinetobacter sp. NCu2D-2 TaxID=1608473 RepID=UPI0007CDDB2F|nr:hypothetical protein [Acinetobacter sp. NCu2D-2]ANF80890.1 hypothetical protein A3K93_00955 [Acinetobacter sp. NCu2D-2]
MQKFLLLLQYACLAFGIYLIYSVGLALYTQEFELMELVSDIGTILICIDLAVFLYTSKAQKGMSVEDYAKQLEQPPSKLVNVTRKLGHLGIMLILCGWIVPQL